MRNNTITLDFVNQFSNSVNAISNVYLSIDIYFTSSLLSSYGNRDRHLSIQFVNVWDEVHIHIEMKMNKLLVPG